MFTGNPNPEALKKFEEQLQQYKSVVRSHGDLIVGGSDDIKIESLNEISQEIVHFSKGELNFLE